jgi:hypothetical protein
MDFYFPDSQDQIEPSYDFIAEERSPFRVRQRDDRYAHEAHKKPAYKGILVSKTIVDGIGGAGRYTAAQRHRLYRLGVRDFFRLDEGNREPLKSMGDCGAFSYVAEPEPPFRPDDVIDFYEGCGFDEGIAIDHVIFGYRAQSDVDGEITPAWVERQVQNERLAETFLERWEARRCGFEPIGVAHGWSPRSYSNSVARLQQLGYRRIALGGMVPLKTPQIIDCLGAIDEVRDAETSFHLLGVTRTENVTSFAAFGVTSFDSTSPFRQAFKDDKDNYYWGERTYTALRIPQVEGNAKLSARIRAGHIDQGQARALEQRALRAVRAYDNEQDSIDSALAALRAYDELQGRKDLTEHYRETLKARPWKRCRCGVCASAGIEVILFRGTERNKRRGFHNLFVFNQRLQSHLGPARRRATPMAHYYE